MENEDKVDLLCRAIIRHMSPLDQAAIDFFREYVGPEERLEVFLAHQILEHSHFSRARWDVSPDGNRLQEIEHHLRQVNRLLEELTNETQLEMCQGSNLIVQEQPKELHLELHSVSTEAVRVISFLRRFPNYQSSMSQRTNWRAASVATCCREHWGIFRQGCFKQGAKAIGWAPLGPADMAPNGTTPSPLINAPLTAHNDRPGPMGLFIEDVFSILDITNDEGEPIRAASALRAASKLLSKH